MSCLFPITCPKVKQIEVIRPSQKGMDANFYNETAMSKMTR